MARVINHSARIIKAPRYSVECELLAPRSFEPRTITTLPDSEWGTLKKTPLMIYYLGCGGLAELDPPTIAAKLRKAAH